MSKYLDTFKVCKICQETKHTSLFHKHKPGKFGVSANCKICANTLRKERHKYKYRTPELSRQYALTRRFGISVQQYEQMLVLQDYKCKICHKEQSLFKRRFSVDHCHQTGKIRGLLCPNCNYALGHVYDSVEILQAMIHYLKENS